MEEHVSVVHTDLDTWMLKQMDEVFDTMLQPDSWEKNLGAKAT